MKKNLLQRALSFVLCLVLVASYLPTGILPAVAVGSNTGTVNKVADPSTKDGWQTYFGTDSSFNTEFAGAVWTDKSVFTDAADFSNITTDSQGNPVSIAMKNGNDMLVALSAMGSNMTVTGQSSVPTDTMLVLDVSGSMNDNSGNNDVAEELAEAANTSIHTLLTSNPNNRVGVVLYSGPTTTNGAASANDAVLLLPLGRYTTNTDGKYVSYTNSLGDETIGIDSDVRVEGSNARPNSVSKEVVGATYIQKGVILAMNQLTAASNQTAPSGITHKPILVLMSDGAPTVSDTDFTNPGSYDLGNGQSSSSNAAQGFVNQLTLAYAKAQIQEKYNTKPLFYTVGLGTTNNTVATSVLDPANSNSGINEFWRQYNTAAVGGNVTVERNKNVTKIATVLDQNYVDKYIGVTANTNLAQGLKDAFEQVITEISLQSKYFPTLVGSNQDLSGYVSFVDKIGSYMSVTDVKGILLHEQLHTGQNLAKNFVADGGIFGTEANPTAAGTAMMESVRDRLGLPDDEAARSLIKNAYYYGQLSYDAQTGAYSNYIGWYADAQGNYMGFYQEGVTTLPADAVYTVKSYGFLGETHAEHGVLASDMMYATVQVRHNIATGEEEMLLKIPASLLPTVTYEVSLDENGDLEDLKRTGATYPFRLLYEVGLDRHINALNVKEYVSQDYLSANTNADGSVNFYTNQYEADNSTGYGKVNTYSYFNPSHQNDRYYFQEDSLLYTDQNGTRYTGADPSSYNGTLYWKHVSYEKENGVLHTDVHYQPISQEVAATAVQTSGANTWYIPEDTVRTYVSGFIYYKGYTSTYDPAQNPTGTLHYAKIPFVDVYGHNVTDANHRFTIGSTLGNNGKLTLTPATGIKLTKVLTEQADGASNQFTFIIDGVNNSGVQVVRLDENGSEVSREALAVSGQVTLTADETVYIIGLEPGNYTVTEETHPKYTLNAITVNSTNQTGTVANATVTAQQMTDIVFTNAPKGHGNLMITKEVRHANADKGHMVPESVLTQEFPVTVKLIGDLTGADLKINYGGADETLTVPADGTVTFNIKHGQTVAIKNLPEGTQATVTEGTVSAPFAYDYILTRDHTGVDQYKDNDVTISANGNATANIYNKYTPSEATADLDVEITKNFIIESALSSATFDFAVQYWNGQKWEDRSTGKITYTGDSGTKTLTLQDVLQNVTYTEAGDYAYRIIEVIPEDADKLPGVSYDRTEYNFTVRVTDNGGQLYASVIDDNEPVTGAYKAAFTNTYHTAPASLDVQKTLDITSGDAEVPKSGFLFEAYVANADFTLADETADLAVRSDATGRARFAATYNAEGTYYYVVREKNEGRSGWNYDNTEYHVTVVVTDDGTGDLSATVTTVKAGSTEPITGPVTFKNKYDPADASVDLDTAVRKELTGRTLADSKFTFAVFENGKASHTSTAGALLTGTNKANGSVNFNGSLTFDEIGVYEYDIVEILPNTDGKANGITYDSRIYDLVVEVTDDHNGKLSATYYFEDETSGTVTFHNSYAAAETTYTATGSKTLTGKALINDEFTFTMTEVDANGAALQGGTVLQTTNAMDGSFAFDAITYTAPGIHYYQISEKQEATTGGITFDRTVYTVRVTVTDNLNGQLVAGATVDGEAGKAIAFTNHYVPAKTSGIIPGDKVLEGKVLGAGAYEFQLYDSNANWENLGVNGQSVTNDEYGKFRFHEIEYTQAGTYYYLVSEVNGGQTVDGVTYDDSVFRVRVTVTDDLKGQLHAETVVFDQDGIPQIGVEFVNVYAVTGDAALVLEGIKSISGRALNSNDVFTFELYTANDKHEISGNPIVTGNNAANGLFSVRVDYTAQNDLGKTYYYVLKEKNAGQTINGVEYTEVVHKITVKVLDDDKGGIKLEVTTDGQQATNNKVTTVTGLNFTNTYSAASTHVALDGTKKLEGIRTLNADDFTFELYETDRTFTVNGTPLLSINNKADGTFTFGSVELMKAQDYYYVVKEKYDANDSIGGVTYDSAIYKVTVTVTDDGKGQLKASNIVYLRNEQSANEILFTNSYDPADAHVTISGKKDMVGRDLNSNDAFTFVLQETDDKFAALAGSAAAEKVISAKGSFAFDQLTFSTPGTYYYTVTEKDGGAEKYGVKYDDTVYKITVVVEDDKDGKLIPTVSVDNSQAKVNVTGTDATVTDVNFRNSYTAKATFPITIDGGKTLFGDRELKADDFTFQMFEADAQFNILGTALQSAKNDENGVFKFENITFDTAGTHYLVIKEDSTNPINGMTYDTTVYHLTFVVEDDLLGKLQVTDRKLQKVTAEGTSDVTEVIFTNSYDAEDATLSLSGKKILQGKDLTDGEFTFQLLQADDQFVPMTGHGVVPSQTVNKGEVFTFDALTYDTVGTYYYVVSEVNTGNARVTFDESVYHVTVTVTDEDGVLKAVATYAKDGKAADQMVFTNVYTPKPADLPLSFTVDKTVKNIGKETIGPEGFTFVLEENANSKLEATTDKDGKAAFQLTVTEDMIGQVYKLKLYEKNDGKANVTYSTAVHEITVTVRLGSDNKLVADLTVDGKAVEQVNVAFENVYDYTIPATPHTGDNTPVVLLFSLLAVSGMAMAAAVIFRKKIFG